MVSFNFDESKVEGLIQDEGSSGGVGWNLFNMVLDLNGGRIRHHGWWWWLHNAHVHQSTLTRGS